MSLVELMMALIITAFVAAAIAGMLGAVSTGVTTRRDARSTMVRANAAATRLAAYVSPSRCVLDLDGPQLTLWLVDARRSDTVHASEVRWLRFDEVTGTLDVHFVSFPPAWSQAARDLADGEYAANADWDAVLQHYETNDWTASMSIVDGLAGVGITADAANALDISHLLFDLQFETTQGALEIDIAATVRLHQPPVG